MNLIALAVVGGIFLLVIALMIAFAAVKFCRWIKEWKAIDQDNDKIQKGCCPWWLGAPK